jgi:hypothetical protein
MIPEYIRFYGGTLESVLNMYTRTFFAMINSMLEIQAKEHLEYMTISAAIQSKDGKKVVDTLLKQQKGLRGIVDEVKIVKKIRDKK